MSAGRDLTPQIWHSPHSSNSPADMTSAQPPGRVSTNESTMSAVGDISPSMSAVVQWWQVVNVFMRVSPCRVWCAFYGPVY